MNIRKVKTKLSQPYIDLLAKPCEARKLVLIQKSEFCVEINGMDFDSVESVELALSKVKRRDV